jgi:hypothetical protein
MDSRTVLPNIDQIFRPKNQPPGKVHPQEREKE